MFMLGLLLSTLVVSPSCSRLVAVVSETVTQTRRLSGATPMSVPTGPFAFPNFLPPAPSELVSLGIWNVSDLFLPSSA
jgi:hypothetical protein